jgi:hypothetical protein
MATDSGRVPSGQALAVPVEPVTRLDPTGFDPSRAMLEADCTGDETLWVARYAFYFQSISGCDLNEAILHANAAWDSWGDDPDTTPEEIASADYAERGQ